MRKTLVPTLSLWQNSGELREFEKLKIYDIVSEKEEFKRDPEPIKIGTKWIVTNKGTKTKPTIQPPLVGKEFADDTKKGELAVCRHARSSRPVVLSVETCHKHVR